MDETEPLEWYERLFLQLVVACMVVVCLPLVVIMGPIVLFCLMFSPHTLGFRSSASSYTMRYWQK